MVHTCFVLDIILPMRVLLHYAHCTALLLPPSKLSVAQKPNCIRYRYAVQTAGLIIYCDCTPCPRKKTSHFNFRHNFTTCWDIFTIFETPCSGLIAGWCNLLHTHHQCEAFTWRGVTHDVIQAVTRSAHWHRISCHLTYGVWTHRT